MKHALVIEDEWVNAAQMQDLLEALGVDSASLAATEDEAIESARACKPDVITADVRLFEGSGPQAVQRICSELGPIPVIFVTGNPELVDALPPSVVLTKPISDGHLRTAYQSFFPA